MTQAAELLNQSSTIAIVGVSGNPERASYQVAKWMLENTKFRIFLVNPVIPELFGLPVFKNISEIPEPIDIVDIFRKSELCVPVVEEAIRVGAKAIWLQLGITSQECRELATAANVKYIEDACIKIEAAKNSAKAPD